MRYSALEKHILKNLRDGSALAYSEAFYPFNKFFEGIKEDIECSEDDLEHVIKILDVEGLLEANIHQGKVRSVQDITGYGLRVLREILEDQERDERLESVIDSPPSSIETAY